MAGQFGQAENCMFLWQAQHNTAQPFQIIIFQRPTLPPTNMAPGGAWKINFLLEDPLSGAILVGGRVHAQTMTAPAVLFRLKDFRGTGGVSIAAKRAKL